MIMMMMEEERSERARAHTHTHTHTHTQGMDKIMETGVKDLHFFIIPLTPKLNPSEQGCPPEFLTGDFKLYGLL